MSLSNKYLKFIFIVVPITMVLALLTSPKPVSTSEYVVGFVSRFGTDSKKAYMESTLDFYEPDTNWVFGERWGTATQPGISGSSGILVDINSGKVLFEKNSEQRLKIASLTKIMTAVVALEHKDPDSKIRVSEKAAGTGENIMGITEGEVYTLEELMYGLLLPSGNDAAYAIAEGVAGSSDRFVEWMNFKAKELGLMNTYFADPSGLDDTTYSTAQDLARLTRYAMKNPRFRSIVGTVDIELPFTETHKYLPLYNQTNLLATYPGVVGVKTGYTEEAGLTLVTYASNEGYELVGVVLNSTDRKGDMVLMLDHGYGTVGVAIEHNLL